MSNKYAILEIVMQSSYPMNMRDYIINIASEFTQVHTNSKVLKVNYKGENLILIKANAGTQFKGRNYDIPVLVYLSKNMPYEAPEIYLEKQQETGVNPKNTDIDQQTNRILTKSLINWNTYFTLLNVYDEVVKSFNATFPIFKITTKSNTTTNTNINTANFSNVNTTGYNTNSNFNTNYTGYNNISNMMNSNVNMGLSNNVIIPNVNMGLNNNIIPNNLINTNQNTNTKVPAYNTIYSSLNISKNTGYTGYDQNQGFQNENFWNDFNNINLNRNTNTNFNNNQTFNNNINTNTNTNFNYTTGYNNNINTNVNPNYNNMYNNNINFNNNQNNNFNNNTNSAPPLDPKKIEEEIKKVLINEIRAKIEAKLKEESKRNKQQEEKLRNYKQEFTGQIEKYSKLTNKKEEIMTFVNNLSNALDNDLYMFQNDVAKMSDRLMNSRNFENFIIVSKPDIIKVISFEACIDDFLILIKKAFEKNILSFTETVKIIRTLSRESMNIKYYRERISSK